MAIYGTAPTVEETEGIDDRVVSVTIAHVPEEAPRLVATVVAAYIFFGYAMHLVLEDFEWFIEMRHKFLRRDDPRNYTVFVRNVPKD